MSLHNISYEYCDTDALLTENTNITALPQDEFVKICPGQLKYKDGSKVPLGQPRCGDGTNFSFLVSRPPQEKIAERDKILIEFSGGGACWDEVSCSLQKAWLSFPQEMFGSLIGTSCTDFSPTMLCGKSIGATNFSDYTTVLVPYCTQDVHLGDQPDTDYGVRHVGAHNLMQTLQWIFANFQDPSHVFITGCSAGATPFPVVYHIINSYYTENGKEVAINGIADSPVFITPSYFLENGIQHWNVGTIMDSIGFDFETYKNDENFPNEVMEYVLQKSKKTDQWGYVTHNADAVSLFYYSFMSGGSFPPRRRTNNDDIQSQWWNKMEDSLSLATNDHDNFHSFVIDGPDHCTFGLNVPIQYEGFAEWASTILQGRDSLLSASNETDVSELTSLNDTALFDVGPSSTPALNSTENPNIELGIWEPPKVQSNHVSYQYSSPGFGFLAVILITCRHF